MQGNSSVTHGITPSYLVDAPQFPFCKGCGHTHVLRRLNDALVALQLPPKDVALVTDIGCIGLADALFKEIHTVHTTHGRSTAFATGIALADAVLSSGVLKTIVLIGDGGAMIGLQHLVHAAMLNANVTVLICNNFVYGMTGGQDSCLTPERFITATTPGGKIVPPIDLCEVLKSSNATFVARTVATDRELPAILQRAITHEGFAAVEILELCTEFAVPQNELTGTKLLEVAAQNNWTLGIIQDRADRLPFGERYKRDLERIATEAKREPTPRKRVGSMPLKRPVNLLLAGSAGERVQSSATVFCRAAVDCGLHVTQKNDNPVTQGSGFSVSELWLSPTPIGYTGIERLEYAVITSEDGYRYFRSAGWEARLTAESHVYLDESLASSIDTGRVIRLPFRKRFKPSRAAIGALAFVAEHHRLVDVETLRAALVERYGRDVQDILAGIEEVSS